MAVNMEHALVIGLSLALVLGIVAHRLKLSPLVGYLVAGILAAQPWWGEPVDSHIVEGFSHLGVILLLFGVGLQFHLKDLLAVQKVAVPGALICMAVSTGMGALVFHTFGGTPDWVSSLMFGLCICVSSTVVLTRVLSDSKLLQTPTGHTALGWLVVEDIFTILMLVLLPVIISGKELGPAISSAAIKLTLLVLCVAFVGRKIIKRVLTYVSRSASGELFTLAVLVFALGFAVLAAEGFDASMEFGAFLSGMVVGQSKFAARAASDALPMKDAFAVLFFVSVGMGFDIGGMLEHWQLTLCTCLVAFFIKPLAAFIVITLLGKPLRMALKTAGALSQIGEFSFILATLIASQYHMLPEYAANVITGVAIITITLNAALYRFIPMLANHLEKKEIGRKPKVKGSVPEPSNDKHRIIVVGYGPCGKIMTDILTKYNLEVVVLEMNIDTVNKLENKGIPVLHGDARRRSILRMAGAEQAKAIIITAAAAPSHDIAESAKEVNPHIVVMAHTTYISTAQLLRRQGAETVFSGEEEVALGMASHTLRTLGATEEQVTRERYENRRRLAGDYAKDIPSGV
ncbi:MAG: sodium:proton exchanger [Akkermansiaceae bacterium]|nr:sodium:proton exchanger [Akkermansiaceae bacterium]